MYITCTEGDVDFKSAAMAQEHVIEHVIALLA